MKKKIFGFDLGIASIGWAVIDHSDENFDPETGEIIEGKVVGCGVRCFPVAENPKDGSSLAAPRREKRLLRRITRRNVCLSPRDWSLQRRNWKRFMPSKQAATFGICVQRPCGVRCQKRNCCGF